MRRRPHSTAVNLNPGGGAGPGAVVAPMGRFPLGGVRLTLVGGISLGIMLLVWYCSVIVEANLLLLLSGMFGGAMVISAGLSAGAVGKLSVSRRVSGTAVAGGEFTIRYRVCNLRSRRVRSIWIREQETDAERVRLSDAYVPVIEAGGTVQVEVRGSALRRGVTRLGRLRVFTSFPFGLVRTFREMNVPGTITMLPRLLAVQGELPETRARDAGQAEVAVGRGDGVDDFLGLREYRPGDNPRWIHWRRSASMGQLVIRQMYPYAAAGCTIVVDHRPGGADRVALARREQAVSAAASLACQALERGLRVGLVLLGERSVAVPVVSGRAHRMRILTELAALEGEPAGELGDSLRSLGRRALHGTRCIQFTSVNDGQVAGLEDFLGRSGMTVTTYCPGTAAFGQVFAELGRPGSSAMVRAGGGV